MTVGDKLYKENKHRKIVLKQVADDSFRIIKFVNTLEVNPRDLLTRAEAQEFIDRGFTVETSGR